MSPPPSAGPADAKAAKDVDRRKSLGKYVKRMSSVFKREKSGKSKSSTPSTPATPSTPVPVLEKKEAALAPAAPMPAPALKPAPSPAMPAESPAPLTRELNRSALQQERARALFAKYGLTLESHEWITTPAQPISVQRVEKPIRMRVHRTCHRCGTTYGADKVCSKCEHKRCKKCPRYPKKKSPAEKGKEKEAPEKPKKRRVLTLASKTGGELVYQPAKQRVRRTCHKCEALFIPPTATICEQCRHIRCTKCPREPAKLNKWPNGYPGDVEPSSETEAERELEQARRVWRKPRTRVRWECEECRSLFLEGSPQCPGCGHARCEKCVRKPLKRVRAERNYDPDVVKAVEAKLKALQMEDDPPSGGVEGT